MDLLRTWIISAAVFLGLNFLLSLTVGYGSFFIYALCPLSAGLVASLYHAARGVGGWPRHLLAVMPAPVVVNGAWFLLTERPESLGDWGVFSMSIVTAGGLSALGFGIAMLIRWKMA
ncbi:hypothetical protein [Nesterenkonia muleiensis]|uniref:hypothetical protein n=1 Tax=Nesterenkonia muleiensis TaxID=2282648 RepID=UPI000E72F732|nr:hypothetical protein [Nesterenkonia muleiensis]